MSDTEQALAIKAGLVILHEGDRPLHVRADQILTVQRGTNARDEDATAVMVSGDGLHWVTEMPADIVALLGRARA